MRGFPILSSSVALPLDLCDDRRRRATAPKCRVQRFEAASFRLGLMTRLPGPWGAGRAGRWWCRVRAEQAEDVPEHRPWDRVDVDEDLVQIGNEAQQVEMDRSENQMHHVALGDHRCPRSV